MKRNEPKGTLTIRFAQDTLTQIERISEEKQRNKTELVRIIVENYLKSLNI